MINHLNCIVSNYAYFRIVTTLNLKMKSIFDAEDDFNVNDYNASSFRCIFYAHNPDQSIYHDRTQVWKTPFFVNFGWKRHPFRTKIADVEAQ